MVTAYPNASGLAGCAQEVFTDRDSKSKYDRGKFIGGFCAWSYWFAWTPVVAIFTMTIGTYLQGFVPALSDVNSLALNLIIGVIIIAAMIVIGAAVYRRSSHRTDSGADHLGALGHHSGRTVHHRRFPDQ